MNSHWIIIGLAAGLCSAVMFASLLYPGFLSFFIFYLSPLPLFAVGLGSGALTAAVGGALAAILVAIIAGPTAALFYFLAAVLAPVTISHVSLLKRPATSQPGREGEASDGQVIWYPEGRIVLWSAAFAAVMIGFFIIAMGGDLKSFYDTLGNQLDLMIAPVIADLPNNSTFNAVAFKQMVMKTVLPGMAAMWLVMAVINFRLAAVILGNAEKSRRPWAPFSHWRLPKSAVIAFAVAIVAFLLPGSAGQAAAIAATLLIIAFVITGLSFLHCALANNSWKGFLLGMVYAGLLLFGWLLLVPLAGLGVFDSVFELRRKLNCDAG